MIIGRTSLYIGIFLLLVSLGMQSCEQTEGIAYKKFENTCWENSDTILFSLLPSQLRQNQLHLEIGFLPDYRYANLYIKGILTSSSGKQQQFLVNDTVIDPVGNWLGKSSRGSILHEFDPALTLNLEEAGTYHVQLLQYMREESLCEIQSVRVW